MGLRILCSGFLVRFPVGGFTWHQFQYLLGLERLGHEVYYFEDFGWPKSCYHLPDDAMTADPSYGIAYLRDLLRPHGLDERWCFLAEDGDARGMEREKLAGVCRECDVYINLSNLNWIPELEECRRRVLIDTDPVFTQIGAHGRAAAFDRYHVLFTYGANVHQPGCEMPVAGVKWLPTRQPVVLDLWPVERGTAAAAPFTTVMSWSTNSDCRHDGHVYGQKDREFERFVNLPRETKLPLEVAVNCEPRFCDPRAVTKRLKKGGWRVADSRAVSRDARSFRDYIRASRGEFSVAKHGYVTSRCGWFSDRSTGYLASGRPVVLQDTGFSDWLPTGDGLFAFTTREEAVDGIRDVIARYEHHCRGARLLAEECFASDRVLSRLLADAGAA